MKKLIFILVCLFSSSITFAQVEKGDMNATTTLSYMSTKGISMGLFLLKGGYFVSDHVELGTSFNLFFMPDDTGVGIGPYATYNFLTADGKLLPYAGANLSIQSTAGASINFFGVYGGSKYFLTESVNIDGGIVVAQGFGDIDGIVFTATVGVGILLSKLR